MYKKELQEYLEHCKKNGYTPRFHYLIFLKKFYTNEEIEWEKIAKRVYGKHYKLVINQ
jgi:hypothetical protein